MTRRDPLRRVRAFTLIEVMIAILVLALGLLGLGAVFPVVVRSQRTATEETLGTSAVNSARAFLSGYDFRSAMVAWGFPREDTRNFWRDWRDDPLTGLNHPSSGPNNRSADEDGYWIVPPVIDATNQVRLGVPANAGQGRPRSSEVLLPVSERLWPQGPAGDPAPQFVWDIAVHRVSDFNGATDSTSDNLEVAVFIRRLDLRIKVPEPYNVYQAITGQATGLPAASRRHPVGVYDTGAQAELPSGDGTGKYARPITAGVEFLFNPPGDTDRDRLYMVENPAVPDTTWQMIRQPGQKLVDNLGQIHTVRNWGTDGGRRYVILESPVKTPASAADTLQQVVFTPQVPASVFVMEVKP